MLVEDENINRKVPSGTTQNKLKLYIILLKNNSKIVSFNQTHVGYKLLTLATVLIIKPVAIRMMVVVIPESIKLFTARDPCIIDNLQRRAI
jgi:hypothetical protein